MLLKHCCMHEPLRIMHLIDSLALGGAERVALNLFHNLNEQGQSTWLCASRQEGPLKDLIREPKQYLFLGKKHATDLFAFWHLIRCIKNNRIQILHAHSTSLAWAVAIKWFTGASLVWHVHYGNSMLITGLPFYIMKFLSIWVNHVICVNNSLVDWVVTTLKVAQKKVTYLPNFPDLSFRTEVPKFEHTNDVPLILCVANLRFPKDHANLVSAIEILHNERLTFKVWLVGKDFHDQYSTELKAQIASAGLEKIIDILGDRTDIADLLTQANIGVLSSASEGLPVSLLEYGLAGLPVVATDVGECCNVVGKCGIIVPPNDASSLANGLRMLILNSQLRHQLGASYKNHISLNFSPEIISKKLIFLYNRLIV